MTNFQPMAARLAGGDDPAGFPLSHSTQPIVLDQQMAPFISDPMELGPFFNSDLHWWMPPAQQMYGDPTSVQNVQDVQNV